jgi:hypothetical protein
MEDYKLRDLRASHTLFVRGTGTLKDEDEAVHRRKNISIFFFTTSYLFGV